MDATTLEALGLTREDAIERLLDRMCERLFSTGVLDEDGEPGVIPSRLKLGLDARIRKAIDDKIDNLAEAHVLPNVSAYIETLCLQATNEWGQPTKKALTFTEYLVERAQHYLTEKVDFDGKTKTESNGYGFREAQTRIAHLVHKHLHYSIEAALKDALTIANTALAQGIKDTVELKLAEIAKAIKVKVETR